MWEKGRRWSWRSCRRGVILQLRNRNSKKRLWDHFHCRSRKESRANTSHLSSAAEKTDAAVDVKAFVNWLLGWITSATERLLLFLYDCQIPPPRGDRQWIYPANDFCLQPRYESPFNAPHVTCREEQTTLSPWYTVYTAAESKHTQSYEAHSALEWSAESELNLLHESKHVKMTFNRSQSLQNQRHWTVFTPIRYMEQFRLAALSTTTTLK